MDTLGKSFEVIDYKEYKEAPYPNSDKEMSGLTLKGKSKSFIGAHEKFKELMKNGKQYDFKGGYMKILDASNKKGSVVAIIEVCESQVPRGNVEMKVYEPSRNKKKGATIELRRLSESEYTQVPVS